MDSVWGHWGAESVEIHGQRHRRGNEEPLSVLESALHHRSTDVAIDISATKALSALLCQRHHENGGSRARAKIPASRVVRLSKLQEKLAELLISYETLASPLHNFEPRPSTLKVDFLYFTKESVRQDALSYSRKQSFEGPIRRWTPGQ